MSHHFDELKSVRMPANIIHKPDIDYFHEDGVAFIDNTHSQIDKVILGTGNVLFYCINSF